MRVEGGGAHVAEGRVPPQWIVESRDVVEDVDAHRNATMRRHKTQKLRSESFPSDWLRSALAPSALVSFESPR